MRLLILLSAMLAGLTGIIAGQPAFAHRGEQAAVASSAIATAEQALEIRVAGTPTSSFHAAAPQLPSTWRLHPAIAPRGERRRE